MRTQFIGKTFWITLGALIASFLIGFFALHTPVSAVLAALIGLITLVLALWKLEIGLLIAFAELFAFSHGHIFSAEIAGFSISLRMAIFVAMMIACTVFYIRKRPISLKDRRLHPYYFLFAAIALGVVIGILQNNRMDMIDDANGFLYALYIFPMLSVKWTAELKRKLLQVFAASVKFLVLSTLFFLYFFSHLGEFAQRDLYVYIRDIRLAEVTRIVGDINRIFMPGQIFAVIFLLILITACFYLWKSKREQNAIAIGIMGTLAVVVASMSRSFWIGLIVGFAAVIAVIMKIRRPSLKNMVTKTGAWFLMLIGSVGILWIVLAIPIPHATDVFNFTSILERRVDEDVAVTSRWKLLPAMSEEIYASPIIGSGFGKIVAFETDDPRVREIYPDGKWRTYRFEWGWHDLWLKMGIFGPIALIWIGIATGAGLIRGFKKDNAWLTIGLFSGLVLLYATHIFSPYLNHPLGLGYLIFLIPFLHSASKRAGSFVHIKEIIENKNIAQQPSAAIPTFKIENVVQASEE